MKTIAETVILGGAVQAEKVLGKAISAIADERSSGPVFLDFSGVEIATFSFLRTSVIGLRDFCRSFRPDCPVVVSNANPAVTEELGEVLRELREAIVVCELSPDQCVSSPRVIGQLDEKQALTFRALLKLGHGDAKAVAMAADPTDESGSFNKWNNRLSALLSKGLVVESSEGRSKVYRPVLEGLSYGN